MGDTDSITIGDNSNFQDNCIIHCTKGFPVKIGKNVYDNVLIGMNATILNDSRTSKNSIFGAGML